MDKNTIDLLRAGVNDLESGLHYTGIQKIKDVLNKVDPQPAAPIPPPTPDEDDDYDEESSSSEEESSEYDED